MEEFWSKFVIRLGQKNPFFACLALFAKLVETESTDIAETVAKELRVNPEFLRSLKEKEAFSYLLHQLLHMALQHTNRGLGRDLQVWNIAADIVVNNIIIDGTNWQAAPHTATNRRFVNCSVEDVYFQLLEQHKLPGLIPGMQGQDSSGQSWPDNPSTPSNGDKTEDSNDADECDESAESDESSDGQAGNEDGGVGSSSNNSGETNVVEPASCEGGDYLDRDALDSYGAFCDLVVSEADKLEAEFNDAAVANEKYWEEALLHAEIATGAKQQGHVPACMQREFAQIERSKIDWRKELWRFVSDRRSDFNEFDTRHLYKGLYLEELRVDGLTLAVAIDTSGSISHAELGVFMKEIEAIQSLHADVTTLIYYCDAAVDGPYKLSNRSEKLDVQPTGGGGTSFAPFFSSIEQLSLTEKPDCLIYFTDGYGDFPSSKPPQPTFWFVTENGIDLDSVPFGRAVSVPTSSYL